MLGPLLSCHGLAPHWMSAVPKGTARSNACGAVWLPALPIKAWVMLNQGQQSRDPQTERFAAEGASAWGIKWTELREDV